MKIDRIHAIERHITEVATCHNRQEKIEHRKEVAETHFRGSLDEDVLEVVDYLEEIKKLVILNSFRHSHRTY